MNSVLITRVLQTFFSDFRINGTAFYSPVVVQWYVYHERHDDGQFSVMDRKQIFEFLNFAGRNARNFPGIPSMFKSATKGRTADHFLRVMIDDSLFSKYIILKENFSSTKTVAPDWVSKASIISKETTSGISELSFPLIGIVI